MDIETTKFVVRNVVSWCVGGTVISLITQNVYPSSKLKKAETAIGATAIGLVIQDQVATYTDQWVDNIADAFNKKQDPVVIVR